MPRPAWFGYGFVGFAGVQKMSSSAGGAPTAQDALRVLEAPILRWLYVRRNPKQTFDIDFGPEVVRLYDEWDSLTRKAADPAKRDTPGAGVGARVGHGLRAVARAPGRRTLPAAGLGRRRDRRLRRADQPDRRPRGRRPRAAARPGHGLDAGVRRPGRPHHRARLPRHRDALVPHRRPARVAAAAARRAPGAARAGGRDLAGLRRAQARPRGWPSTTSRPTRSRPTRSSSSACSTGCWSVPSAAPAFPTLVMALGADRCACSSAADLDLRAARPPPPGWSRAGRSSTAPTRRSRRSRGPPSASSASARRNPRFGSCSHGTGP